MDSLPPMRPLVMVLKVFLQQRELNEVSQLPDSFQKAALQYSTRQRQLSEASSRPPSLRRLRPP